jgi:hypothetical protein
MKFWMLLLCLSPSLALADIYKFIDADGHVTYSSSPMKGAKKIVMTPDRPQQTSLHATATPGNFPKVDEATQKSRDGSRRTILEDELKTEDGLLAKAKQDLQTAEEKHDPAKISEMKQQVDLHQGNIVALKSELSGLK